MSAYQGPMVQVKTAELIGKALDYAVAVAEGHPLCEECMSGAVALIIGTGYGDLEPFAPSTDWGTGGALLEKHAIGFVGQDAFNWLAFSSPADETHRGIGPTHLIAACRLIVAATTGLVVSVPAEALE